MLEKATISTPLGYATIFGTNKGVEKITINTDENTDENIPKVLQNAVLQLNEYFYQNRNQFTFLINPIGTPFQEKVWQELLKIPFGKTISYLDLATKIGDPKATRAVANANAKNKLWIVIPCHRVIGNNGQLTGYAGGLWRKKWLLEHENNTKQTQLFD